MALEDLNQHSKLRGWGSKGAKLCEGCHSSCSVRWEGGASISEHAGLMELASWYQGYSYNHIVLLMIFTDQLCELVCLHATLVVVVAVGGYFSNSRWQRTEIYNGASSVALFAIPSMRNGAFLVWGLSGSFLILALDVVLWPKIEQMNNTISPSFKRQI